MVAVSGDDEFLFVNAFMSRELVVYRTEAFRSAEDPVARVSLRIARVRETV